MSKQCPITLQHCHDPLCEGRNICLLNYKRPEDLTSEITRHLKHEEWCKEELYKIILEQVGIISRLIKDPIPSTKPLLVLTTIINSNTFIMADIKLTLGATQKDGVFALLDTVTGAFLTGVVFSKQSVGANSNPAAATFAIDPADTTGNSVLPTPLAAGSGTIGFAATATYTDSTGVVHTDVAFTVTKNFSVILGADGVALDVVFK